MDRTISPPQPVPTPAKTSHPGDRPLLWIAGYNFTKGLLLLLLAFGFLGFLHRDLDTIVGGWLSSLGMNLENVHIVALLARLDVVTDNQLKLLSGVTFLLGGIFLVEGVGLYFRQRWAEYLTLLVTASFIPLELFEIFRHGGPLKLLLLVVNVAIVWSLTLILKRNAPPAQSANLSPKR